MNAIEKLIEYAEQNRDIELAKIIQELMKEIQMTFGWMVVFTRDKFDSEFGAENYSEELKKAMEYVGL